MARFSPYWLWILLALPGLGLVSGLLTSTDPEIYQELLQPHG